DSAASRHLLTVRESGAPSLASHAGSRGRGARRMPWESFAVGGPDEAREFWTAAVSDARALPPGGRDGLGGDAGARARARAVAADPSRGRDDRVKRRETAGAERDLKRVQANVGQLAMKLEIMEWFLAETTTPPGLRRHYPGWRPLR